MLKTKKSASYEIPREMNTVEKWTSICHLLPSYFMFCKAWTVLKLFNFKVETVWIGLTLTEQYSQLWFKAVGTLRLHF